MTCIRVYRLFQTSRLLYLVLMLLTLLKKNGSAVPSIASVVAFQDWHEVSKYNSVVHAQGHTEEISGLEDIVKELLHAFANESKKKLWQLIFYRLGTHCMIMRSHKSPSLLCRRVID